MIDFEKNKGLWITGWTLVCILLVWYVMMVWKNGDEGGGGEVGSEGFAGEDYAAILAEKAKAEATARARAEADAKARAVALARAEAEEAEEARRKQMEAEMAEAVAAAKRKVAKTSVSDLPPQMIYPTVLLGSPPPLPALPKPPSGKAETVKLRPCTVWYTKYKEECNSGLYSKDLNVLRNMSYDLIRAELMDFTVKSTAYQNALTYTNTYKPYYYITMKGDNPATAEVSTNTSIFPELYENFKNDQERKNQEIKNAIANLKAYMINYQFNQEYIDLVKSLQVPENRSDKASYIAVGKNLQASYRSLATLEKARDLAEVALINKKSNSMEFQKLDQVIKEREQRLQSGKSDRCKVEYPGWFELDSDTNPHFKDPVKDTSDPNLSKLGAPHTWAECYKLNSTLSDWSKFQADYENIRRDYPDIQVGTKPVDIGKGQSIKLLNVNGVVTDVNSTGPYINKIVFNSFNVSDTSECDDTIVKPNYPQIENGLIEIKISPALFGTDTIASIRKVGYINDSRYIQTSSNMEDIPAQTLLDVFFDYGLEFSPEPVLYVRPSRDVQYSVKNLYEDPKCRRFFGNTNATGNVLPSYEHITGTPSLMMYFSGNPAYTNADYPAIVYTTSGQAEKKEKPVFFSSFARTDIAKYTSTTVKELFNDLLALNRTPDYKPVIQKIIDETLVDDTEWPKRYPDYVPFTWANMTRDSQLTQYVFTTEERLDINNRSTVSYKIENQNICFQGNGLLHAVRNQFQKNIDYFRAGLENEKIRARRFTGSDLDILTRTVTRMNNYIDKATQYISALDTMIADIQQKLLQTGAIASVLRSYIGKPVTRLLPYYEKNYMSTENTVYLAISRFNRQKNVRLLFYQQGTGKLASDSSIMTPAPNVVIPQVMDDYVAYKDTAMVNPNLASSVANNKSIIEKFITNTKGVIERFEEPNWKAVLLDSQREPLFYITQAGKYDVQATPYFGQVEYIRLKPNVMVVVKNERNFTNVYSNSYLATSDKTVMLNSTMTGKLCDIKRNKQCILTSLTMSKIV